MAKGEGKREEYSRTLSGLGNHFSLGIGAHLPIRLRSTSWSFVKHRARENHAHQGRGRLPFPDGKCMHCAATSTLGTTAKVTARLDIQGRISPDAATREGMFVLSVNCPSKSSPFPGPSFLFITVIVLLQWTICYDPTGKVLGADGVFTV